MQKWKSVSSYNLGQKVGDNFKKLNKLGFSMECFTSNFVKNFYKKLPKFCFPVDGWVLAIKSKYFKDFLETSIS